MTKGEGVVNIAGMVVSIAGFYNLALLSLRLSSRQACHQKP